MSSLMFFGKIWDELNWKIKNTYLYILGFIITYGGMLCTKTIGCILIGASKGIKKDIVIRITQITFKANEKMKIWYQIILEE